MPTNDNDSFFRGVMPTSPDAHGQAALLLVESLIHGLCEASVLSTGMAIEIVERAADVQSEQAEVADGAGATMWHAHALLLAIVGSLKSDGDDSPSSQLDP